VEKEQEYSAARIKEDADEAKKSKVREEEEFQYNLRITRKKRPTFMKRKSRNSKKN